MSEPLKYAVDLLTLSAQAGQSWITRFIAVNGALFSAVAAIVGWGEFKHYHDLLTIVLSAICMFGTVISILLGGILVRQMGWNKAYRSRIRSMEGGRQIMPDESEVPGGFLTWTITLVTAIRWFVPLLWIFLLVEINFIIPWTKFCA